MAVTAGDVLLVTYKGTLVGQTILNTFHYGMSIVTGAPSQDAVATEVLSKLATAGGFSDKYLACCPSNYTLDEVWVQFILDTRFRKKVGTYGSVGTSAFAANSANQSMTISRFGAAANRRNMGSVHIPLPNKDTGISNGENSGTQMSNGLLFEPFLYTPLALATLGTISPILIHGASRLNAIPLVGANTQLTVRVNRRRTVGVGK